MTSVLTPLSNTLSASKSSRVFLTAIQIHGLFFYNQTCYTYVYLPFIIQPIEII